jgi:DNA-binding beta-propeller fold protein YncE
VKKVRWHLSRQMILVLALFAMTSGLHARARQVVAADRTVQQARATSSTTLTADAVLGQPDFTTPTCDNPLLSPSQQLCHPVGVAVDSSSGLLFVADGDNNRILIWPSAEEFTNSQPAMVVLGQPDFSVGRKCTGSTSARTICDPNGLAVDASGRLFVADTDGDRILRFSPPFSSDMAADLVIGQRSFTTSICGLGPASLCHPRDVGFDASGNLYVADSDNNRALVFKAPLTSAQAATLVIGQATFKDKHCNRNGPPAADTLCGPKGLALDSAGNLYIAEDDNSRVLEFSDPLHSPTSDISANLVFGQPSFSTNACSLGPSGLCNPDHVAIGLFGQLIVSDGGNNRLLVYDKPLSNATANQVIGQPDFNSNAPATTASGFAGPKGITVDDDGNLYATDEDNNRVLRFDRAE